MRGWLQLAMQGSVVRRACVMAAIVGTILAAINHGDAIMRGSIDGPRLARILLTYFVPYAVSTISSVAAVRDAAKGKR